MSINYKVIEDKLKEASKVLDETLAMIEQVSHVAEYLEPFTKEKKQEYGSLPKYIAQCTLGLKNACISGFELNYPALAAVVSNGQNDDDGMRRLHDGLYWLGQLNAALVDCKYLVKTDVERSKMYEQTKKIVSDLAIFLIIQYRLYVDTDQYYLSVSKYCERCGITPSVFYGDLLLKLEWANVKPYGYEVISEWYQPLLDMDPVFVAECEEFGFPLTDEMSERIATGVLPIAEARAELTQFLQQSEEKEIEGVTPLNMIEKMNLS